MSSVTEEISELKDTVRTGLHDTAEGGKRVMSAVGAAANDTVKGLRTSATQVRDSAATQIADRPFTSIAIAFGVGALLGAGLMWKMK
jgi:ElaB/YqjD/DUF883 family membrane-anchored ribosome-binding protein